MYRRNEGTSSTSTPRQDFSKYLDKVFENGGKNCIESVVSHYHKMVPYACFGDQSVVIHVRDKCADNMLFMHEIT